MSLPRTSQTIRTVRSAGTVRAALGDDRPTDLLLVVATFAAFLVLDRATRMMAVVEPDDLGRFSLVAAAVGRRWWLAAGLAPAPAGAVGLAWSIEADDGPDPAGGGQVQRAPLATERAFLLAGSIGGLERQIVEAVGYANERTQFGQPIGVFQGVSHQIADMKVAHENARLLLYKAVALQAKGQPSMMAAALAKLAASEAALAGAVANVRVHGARGYVSEHGVERGVRDAMGGVIYGGSSDIQRNIVARLLGLPG